jgi:hypothetical protein
VTEPTTTPTANGTPAPAAPKTPPRDEWVTFAETIVPVILAHLDGSEDKRIANEAIQAAHDRNAEQIRHDAELQQRAAMQRFKVDARERTLVTLFEMQARAHRDATDALLGLVDRLIPRQPAAPPGWPPQTPMQWPPMAPPPKADEQIINDALRDAFGKKDGGP